MAKVLTHLRCSKRICKGTTCIWFKVRIGELKRSKCTEGCHGNRAVLQGGAYDEIFTEFWHQHFHFYKIVP